MEARDHNNELLVEVARMGVMKGGGGEDGGNEGWRW